MIYFTDCYAKVWEIKCGEKYVDLKISTSEKDQNGEYKYSHWFARCFGKAFEAAGKIKEGDRIKILKGKVVNETYTDKDGNKKSFIKVIIIDFEKLDSEKSTAQAADIKPKAESKQEQQSAPADDDYPF